MQERQLPLIAIRRMFWCRVQGGSANMRRLIVYVKTDDEGGLLSPLAIGNQPALRVRWYTIAGRKELQAFSSAAELLAAVRKFAGMRSVAASLHGGRSHSRQAAGTGAKH